jgi:ribonuclease D
MFREEEARRQHRPLFFVVPDSVLVSLAMIPTTTLSDVPGLGQTGLQRYGRGLEQAIRDGLAAPPIYRPTRVAAERLSHEQSQRLTQLKDWRVSLGATLSLDPSLLWPMASLGRLAKTPHTIDVELTSSDVRRWQRDNFALDLRAYLESLP